MGVAALESSHLPPSAVLLVRRLRDPLPRRLLSSRQGIIPSAEWETAMRSAVDRCAREAARPAMGPVPAAANAVVFYDQAELLACLARDLVAGEATLHWWWIVLLRSLPNGAMDALVATWCRHSAAIPAALELLVRAGAAQRVLAALPTSQTLALVRAVATAFELPQILDVLANKPRELNAEVAPHSAQLKPTLTVEQASPLLAKPPPWAPMIAQSVVPSSLGAERELLLGLCLMLARVPAIARSKMFLGRVAAWWNEVHDRAAELRAAPLRESATAATTPEAGEKLRARDELSNATPAAHEIEVPFLLSDGTRPPVAAAEVDSESLSADHARGRSATERAFEREGSNRIVQRESLSRRAANRESHPEPLGHVPSHRSSRGSPRISVARSSWLQCWLGSTSSTISSGSSG